MVLVRMAWPRCGSQESHADPTMRRTWQQGPESDAEESFLSVQSSFVIIFCFRHFKGRGKIHWIRKLCKLCVGFRRIPQKEPPSYQYNRFQNGRSNPGRGPMSLLYLEHPLLCCHGSRSSGVDGRSSSGLPSSSSPSSSSIIDIIFVKINIIIVTASHLMLSTRFTEPNADPVPRLVGLKRLPSSLLLPHLHRYTGQKVMSSMATGTVAMI